MMLYAPLQVMLFMDLIHMKKKTMKVWWQRIWEILIIVAVRWRMHLLSIEEIIKDLSEAELRDEKVLKVVLKKCIESKSDIKSMADGKSLDMLTDKIMELVRDVYL